MHSTLNPKPPDPIARYFEQVALEDEQIARTLADDAARHPPAAVNNVQVPGDRPSFGRAAVRGFVGLLLAACIGVAAVAWQSSGDAAKPIIARWAPQLVLTSSLPLEKPGLPRNPPRLPFRRTRRRQHLRNRQLRLRPHRKASRRPQPRYLPNRRSCFSRWRVISQAWGRRSNSSRPASSSSRPTRNK